MVGKSNTLSILIKFPSIAWKLQIERGIQFWTLMYLNLLSNPMVRIRPGSFDRDHLPLLHNDPPPPHSDVTVQLRVRYLVWFPMREAFVATEPNQIEPNRTKPNRTEPNQQLISAQLSSKQPSWAQSNWTELNPAELNRNRLNWTELNSTELKSTGLS